MKFVKFVLLAVSLLNFDAIHASPINYKHPIPESYTPEPVEPKPTGPVFCIACVECVDCEKNPEMAIHCPSTCIRYRRPDPKPYTFVPFDSEPAETEPVEPEPVEPEPIETEPIEPEPIEPEPIAGPVFCMACVECVDCEKNPEMAIHCPSTCKRYKRPNPKPYVPKPFNPEPIIRPIPIKPVNCIQCIDCVDCDANPSMAINCPHTCKKKVVIRK